MNLRERVMSGLLWSGGARIVGQLFNWAVTIFVIRLLTPEDYGLLAMTMVFFNVLNVMGEAGLGAAVVQKRSTDEAMLRRVFGAVILVDVVLFVVQFASAPLIASFYGEERLVDTVRALAASFLLGIFSVIPAAQLSRTLDFRKMALLGLGSGVGAAITTLLCALAGLGVWALVLGNLVGVALHTVLAMVVAPFWKRPVFAFREISDLLTFGGQVTGSRLLWIFYSQADMLIGGKMLGKEQLGFYSVSMHLASLPVQRISAVLNNIAFPAFAQAQSDPQAVPHYILKVTRILTIVAFPLTWGISSIAPEIVAVLLGPKWETAAVPLQWLPLVMPLSILSPFLNSAFQGLGRGGVVFSNVLTLSVALPLAFWIGAHWGLIGLSVAWLAGFPPLFLLNLRRMLPLVGLTIPQVLRAGMLPALAAAGMYGCVAAARLLLAPELSSLPLMAALIAVGAAGYAAITLATNRKGVTEVIDLFRRKGATRHGTGPAPGDPPAGA